MSSDKKINIKKKELNNLNKLKNALLSDTKKESNYNEFKPLKRNWD